MFIKDGPSTLIGFIDWLALIEGGDVFCTSILAVFFCLTCVGVGVFILYSMGCYFGASF